MIQRTLGQAKEILKTISGVTGYRSNSGDLTMAINRATEELLRTGDYPSVVDRYKIVTSNRTLTLPYYLDRVLGISVNGTPIEMRRPWIEFDQYGPGSQHEYTGVDLTLDKGDAPTFLDIPNDTGRTYQLKIESTGIEAGTERVLVTGWDANGDWIRSEEPASSGTYIDGVYITIDTTSSQQFSEIDRVVKPQTKGFLTMKSVDDLGAEVVIAEYHPNELRPSYRRYFNPFISDGSPDVTIRVRARKRYYDLKDDNDFLIIPNVDALENMIIAQGKRRSQKPNEYKIFKNLAIECLIEEANSYNGYEQSPVIRMSSSFGVGAFEQII